MCIPCSRKVTAMSLRQHDCRTLPGLPCKKLYDDTIELLLCIVIAIILIGFIVYGILFIVAFIFWDSSFITDSLGLRLRAIIIAALIFGLIIFKTKVEEVKK